MARLRQVYDSGAVVQLPFLTLSQLPPAALLNDPRLDYLPPGASLAEVRSARASPGLCTSCPLRLCLSAFLILTLTLTQDLDQIMTYPSVSSRCAQPDLPYVHHPYSLQCRYMRLVLARVAWC